MPPVCRATGPAAARPGARPGRPGWAEDQRWTLERVTTLIGRPFHVRCTLRGTSYLLHRMGYAPQVPVHRAAERDEQEIATWRDVTQVSFDASGDRGVFVLRGRGSNLGNLGSCSTVHQLAAIIKNRLNRIQYRPALIDGLLAQTGLGPEPEPPWAQTPAFQPLVTAQSA
jgi:hypothetical protein